MLLFTKRPEKFQPIIKQLEGYKIVTQIVVPSSNQPLKKKFTETKNVLLMLIDFHPESAEYDESTSLAKIDKIFPQATLMSFITVNYDPLRMPGFKIICDRWIQTPSSSAELIKIIIEEKERTKEKLLFQERIRFRMPTESTLIEKSASILEQFLKRSTLSQKSANVFFFAIQEAITNSVLYGNMEKKDRYLEMEYLLDDQKVQFKIQDEGPGFDYETYLRKAQLPKQYLIARAKNMSYRKGAGIGIISMKKCADEIIYTPPGNTLTITKYLKKPEINKSSRS